MLAENALSLSPIFDVVGARAALASCVEIVRDLCAANSDAAISTPANNLDESTGSGLGSHSRRAFKVFRHRAVVRGRLDSPGAFNGNHPAVEASIIFHLFWDETACPLALPPAHEIHASGQFAALEFGDTSLLGWPRIADVRSLSGGRFRCENGGLRCRSSGLSRGLYCSGASCNGGLRHRSLGAASREEKCGQHPKIAHPAMGPEVARVRNRGAICCATVSNVVAASLQGAA